VHLTVNFVPPPQTDGLELGGVVIAVHFEMYDGLPVLRKFVAVHNDGAPAAPPVEVQALRYEQLRVPNWAPGRMSVHIPEASNPTPFDDTVKPDAGPGTEHPGVDLPSARSVQYWFFDPKYEHCCDGSLHLSWTYYTYLSLGYSFSTAYNGSTGPGAIVQSGGGHWESLSVRLLLHDTNEVERKSLGIREMQRTLAPQLREAPVMAMINDISTTEIFRGTIDQMASTGLNLAVLGYGCAGWCAMCREVLHNATYKAWLKGEIQYANTRGVSVSAYTLMQSAGGVPNISEDTLRRDGKRGVACFATDYHAQWRADVLAFMGEVGLSGLETDGQYEGAQCADTHGDHRHNGIKGGWSYQIQAALDFNANLKAIGAYQTGADAYYWHGANRWNHADTDAFGGLPLWEMHTVGRMYVFDSTIGRLPTSGTLWVGDIASATNASWNGRYNSSHDRCEGRPRLACIDFLMAGYYINAVQAGIHTSQLWNDWDPDKTEIQRIMLKWTTFYKAHGKPRTAGAPGVLLDKLIHLQRPDSRNLEANLHVTADPTMPVRALLAIVNPTNVSISESLTLPLWYADMKPNDRVNIEKVTIDGEKSTADAHRAQLLGDKSKYVVGGGGAGFTDVVVQLEVAPNSYGVFAVSLQAQQ
jgi:hypothetical protein